MYFKSKNVSKVWLSKVVLTSMSTGFVIADFDRLKKQQESKAAENQLNSYDIRVRVQVFSHLLFKGILILLVTLSSRS